MKSTFVDTSAFVALVDRKDRNHAIAKRTLKALAKTRTPLITSAFVADEVITLVRMRLSHAIAVQTGEALLRSQWCRLLEVDHATRESAWNIFVRYDDQSFSFTDCTSFALMRALDADEAFTFDRSDFAAAGFTVIPAK
jgi:predicted nucleic acid-binding protein